MTNQQRKQQIHQAIASRILEQLDKGVMSWRKGWKATAGYARNGLTQNRYKGVNSYLTIISLCCGYSSNDWLTFNQIHQKGYKFKKDENGNCLARDTGCPVIYYEQRDRLTKQRFTPSTLQGMTDTEKAEYMRKNVAYIIRSFTVFNASLIEGYEERKNADLIGDYNPDDELPSAEQVVDLWRKLVPIFYGGESAYYSPSKDEIHLPERTRFLNVAEFYGTAFHEIAHSSGADSRLQRNVANSFGSEEYAQEELIAEFTSAFLRAELGIGGEHSEDFSNTVSYIDGWKKAIKKNPDCLIDAIKQAEIAANYITEQTNLTRVAA